MGISKSSYEYQRARLSDRRDRDADIRPLVRELFAAENGSRGYRAVHARMRRADVMTCEGFFGRLKNEFFHRRDWSGADVEAFMSQPDAYLEHYCEGRIKEPLGWMSPNEYRKSLGYAS